MKLSLETRNWITKYLVRPGWIIVLVGIVVAGLISISSKKEEPVNQTANWKLYTNDKYGFEVKYPSNLKVEIADNSGGTGPIIAGIYFSNPHLVSLPDGRRFMDTNFIYLNVVEPIIECPIFDRNMKKTLICTAEGLGELRLTEVSEAAE